MPLVFGGIIGGPPPATFSERLRTLDKVLLLIIGEIMDTEQSYHEHHHDRTRIIHRGGSGAVYGLGFIGAAVYFISQATTFWVGVLGFLKAMVWPALKYLKL
jgi:hypothetical protein